MAEVRSRLSAMAFIKAWYFSGLLLVVYVLVESVTYLMGGDRGAFLYVTFHFIVMPLLSALTILWVIVRTFRAPTLLGKLLSFSSVIVPLAIILVAITGRPGLSRLFDHFS